MYHKGGANQFSGGKSIPREADTLNPACIIMYIVHVYMCVNMHTIKVETLEATSTESL